VATVEFKWLVTRGCHLSTGRWVRAFGGSLQCVRCPRVLPSEGATVSLALGAINRSGDQSWLVLGTLGLSVHAWGVLVKPLTHICLIVIIRLCE